MDQFDEEVTLPAIRELSKQQRRVLAVLVEKAMTVPESYPLTLKSATVGCNQKSNRAPVTNYTEDAVLQTLDELREMGLVAVVHTESGRTERYRHYIRKRFTFTEPQLAILTELLLRGRQQLGELRTRASRMVPVESLEDLRAELEGLLAMGYVQANGPLERRGIEVDHAFYLESENMKLGAYVASRFDDEPAGSASTERASESSSVRSSSASQEIESLRQENQELRTEVQELRNRLDTIEDSLQDLRQSLGA